MAGQINNDQVVIRLKGVTKKYRLYNNKLDRMKEALHPMKKKYHKDFYALHNVDLEVKKGEILGIIGKNGSGKSTLLKIISGVITPTSGEVFTKGSIVPLLQLGSGFNPDYSGIENIFFYSSVLGYSKSEMNKKVDDIIAFADIGDYLYQPVRTYSTGMKARLAFAVSIHIDPDILILDEILSVGDELFRRKCYTKMQAFFQSGKTILFVSHSVQSINELCQRAVFLDQGEMILQGDSRFVTMIYQKYLFTDFGNQSDLLEEIKTMIHLPEKTMVSDPLNATEGPTAGLPSIIDHEEEFGQAGFQPRPFFIPGFIPKTTTVTRNAKIVLDELRIETPDGEKVNVLLMNEDYFCCYRLHFQEEAHKVRFSLSFTSMKGFLVTSSLSPPVDEPIEFVPAGTKYDVKWKFTCSLLKGNYFIEVAVISNNGQESVYLIRMVDALAIKVMEHSRGSLYGLVTLNQQMTFESTRESP